LKKVPPRTLSQKLSILKKVKTHGMSFQIHTSPVCGSLHAMAKNFRFESFEGRFFILCDDKNNFAGCRNINYFSAGKISITHTKCAYRVASATYS